MRIGLCSDKRPAAGGKAAKNYTSHRFATLAHMHEYSQPEHLSRLRLVVSLLRSNEKRVQSAHETHTPIMRILVLVHLIRFGMRSGSMLTDAYTITLARDENHIKNPMKHLSPFFPPAQMNNQVQLAALSVCANLSRHHAARGPLRATECARICAHLAGTAQSEPGIVIPPVRVLLIAGRGPNLRVHPQN